MPKFWLAMLFAAACYQPTPSVDVPCGGGEACPEGQTCIAGRCELGTGGIDARIVDGARDSSSISDGGGDASSALITWKNTTTASLPPSAGSVTVQRPTSANGDVFVATIAMGVTNAAMQPTFTPPTGWTLVRRSDRASDTTLAVYTHTAGIAEPATYTWQFSNQIEGVAWISSYSGVNPVNPVEADAGMVIATTGPTYSTASITTTTPNAMVVMTFAGHGASLTTWTTPTGTSTRANLNNNGLRSGLGADKLFPVAGATGPISATASAAQDYALFEVLALAPK